MPDRELGELRQGDDVEVKLENNEVLYGILLTGDEFVTVIEENDNLGGDEGSFNKINNDRILYTRRVA